MEIRGSVHMNHIYFLFTLGRKSIKHILSMLSDVFKSSAKRIFLFFSLMVIILLSFAHSKLPEINTAQKPSTINNFINSPVEVFNNLTGEKIRIGKSVNLRRFLPDNYIYIKSITGGKAENLNKFIEKDLLLENYKNPTLSQKSKKSEKSNPLLSEGFPPLDNCNICAPVCTGRAVPLVYNPRSPVFLFPPPIVVVANRRSSPPPVPIPEVSSVLLSLTGLGGILGFRKKLY